MSASPRASPRAGNRSRRNSATDAALQTTTSGSDISAGLNYEPLPATATAAELDADHRLDMPRTNRAALPPRSDSEGTFGGRSDSTLSLMTPEPTPEPLRMDQESFADVAVGTPQFHAAQVPENLLPPSLLTLPQTATNVSAIPGPSHTYPTTTTTPSSAAAAASTSSISATSHPVSSFHKPVSLYLNQPAMKRNSSVPLAHERLNVVRHASEGDIQDDGPTSHHHGHSLSVADMTDRAHLHPATYHPHAQSVDFTFSQPSASPIRGSFRPSVDVSARHISTTGGGGSRGNSRRPSLTPRAAREMKEWNAKMRASEIADGGGATPAEPNSYLQHLSASFLNRIPSSLKHATRILSPGSILMNPMLASAGSGTTARRMSRAGSILSTTGEISSRKLSLSEMADQARMVRKQNQARALAPGSSLLTPTGGANAAAASAISRSRASSNAQSLISPLAQLRQTDGLAARRPTIVEPNVSPISPSPPSVIENAVSTVESIKAAIATGESPQPPTSADISPKDINTTSGSINSTIASPSGVISTTTPPADKHLQQRQPSVELGNLRPEDYLPVPTGTDTPSVSSNIAPPSQGSQSALSVSATNSFSSQNKDSLISSAPLSVRGLDALDLAMADHGDHDHDHLFFPRKHSGSLASATTADLEHQHHLADDLSHGRVTIKVEKAVKHDLTTPPSETEREFSRRDSGLGIDSDVESPQQSLLASKREKDEIEIVHVFLEEMGGALFSCGLPMHVVEFYLVLAAHRLNVECNIVAISTSFWITFAPSSVAHMVIAKNPGLSLARMVDICIVSEHILHGMCSPVEGLGQLQQITARPPRYPRWMQLPCLVAASFMYAPLFSAGWLECAVSAIIGFFIGLMELYSENHPLIARGHDLMSGLFAGGIAILFHSYVQKINLLAATFGGIVWVLPGLRVTMSMLDLSTGNPVTGTAKFMSSLITAMNLGIGVVAGISLGKLTGVDQTNILNSASYGAVPEWFIPCCVILVNFPQIVLLDAHMNHFPQYVAGSALSFYLSSYAGEYIGDAFGTWIASAGVGIFCNLYGRVTRYPAIELCLFSILMLVPGSIGVRSVLASDAISTVGFLTKMLTVAVAIVTGLFTANIVVPPVRAL